MEIVHVIFAYWTLFVIFFFLKIIFIIKYER